MRTRNWWRTVAVLVSVGLLGSMLLPTQGKAERTNVKKEALKRSATRSRAVARPLYFESNQGQVAEQINFLSRGKGYTLALTATEAHLILKPAQRVSLASDDSTSTSVRMQVIGANPEVQATGRKPLSGKVNYFLGNDPTQWQTDIPTYAKAHYQDIYPGIDLVYYGNQGQLEYDFIVQPETDPSIIQLTFTGAASRLDETGNLRLETSGGELLLRKPYIYQDIDGKRQSVEGGCVLSPSSPQSLRGCLKRGSGVC